MFFIRMIVHPGEIGYALHKASRFS